jgi:segregation and condensation protein B
MNEFYTRNVLEAALLAAGKPLQIADLGQLFDENTRPKVEDIRGALDALAAEYANRGVEVKETAAGFRIQVRREFASEISRLWPERPARYSRALLETLALIAYRQPITRAEIEAVRGVAVNPNIVKTVIERNWVRVVGHRDVPGRPELLGTTREFLDYFGLRSLDELPALVELKAMGEYNLQLELPNAGALGIETPDAEVEGADGVAVAVAGLLTSDDLNPAATDLAVAEPNGDASEAAHDAVADADGAPRDGHARHAAAEANGDAGEGAHDAVADATGTHDEAEADRTLSAGNTSKHAADSDDPDTSDNAISSESSDALDDAADDDSDEDELSADGHGSRELVAAPRDIDD